MKNYDYLPTSILFFGFALIYGTIMFAGASVELEFISFIITTVLFGIFRIDSRFLILMALLHLWFAPFMLMDDFKDIAEKTAVYAYYYLIVGVILQFIEFKFKIENSIDIEYFFKKILSLNYIIPVIFIIIILISNYFLEFLEIITRNIYIYVLSLFILLLFLRYGSFFEIYTNKIDNKIKKTPAK